MRLYPLSSCKQTAYFYLSVSLPDRSSGLHTAKPDTGNHRVNLAAAETGVNHAQSPNGHLQSMSHQQQGLARCFTMNAMHAQRHGSDHRPTSSRGRSDRTCRSLRLPVAAWLASAWLALSASAYQNSFFGAQRPFSGQPAGPVRQVQLTCLNTFAGPPFNFRMR